MGQDVSPAQRIDDMIRITELCVDLLKENEEHHGEVSGGSRVQRGIHVTRNRIVPLLIVSLKSSVHVANTSLHVEIPKEFLLFDHPMFS